MLRDAACHAWGATKSWYRGWLLNAINFNESFSRMMMWVIGCFIKTQYRRKADVGAFKEGAPFISRSFKEDIPELVS